jgi:hypothetical protein
MAIRSSRRSSSKKRKSRWAFMSQLRSKPDRTMQLEQLETRQLLAIGPQLIGIQPNNGSLLRLDQVDILNERPQELIFKFDQVQRFDVNALRNNPGQIQITRSNKAEALPLDEAFKAASASTDFGTNGNVQVTFTAKRLGQEQNGIAIVFTKSN